MAEWFAVPCRALAGIAIIARDNSHNRDFTCKFLAYGSATSCCACKRQRPQVKAPCGKRGQRAFRRPDRALCLLRLAAARNIGAPTAMARPSRRFGGRARGVPISSGSRAGCGWEIGPWCRSPVIARQCGAAVGARRVARRLATLLLFLLGLSDPANQGGVDPSKAL